METENSPQSPEETTRSVKRSSRSLFDWIRQLLGRHEKEIAEAGEPPSEETVSRLIDKAVTGKLPAQKETGEDREDGAAKEDGEGMETGEEKQDGEERTCSYALKRNIVESLRAIREFAERHNLAETMLRALLTLLAEMAVGALKGKVGEKALETLLRAMTLQQYSDEADNIPHLGGLIRKSPDEDNIFSMAREA